MAKESKLQSVYFGMDMAEAAKMAISKAKEGYLVKMYCGYDFWGRFDGTISVYVAENRDLNHRRIRSGLPLANEMRETQ